MTPKKAGVGICHEKQKNAVRKKSESEKQKIESPKNKPKKKNY